MRHVFAFVLLSFLVFPRPADAQDTLFAVAGLPVSPEAVASLPDQILLSTDEIERALASYPDIRGFADRHAQAWAGYRIDPASQNPLGDVRAKLARDGSLGEFENAVRRHGFQGFDDWTRTVFSIAAAQGFGQTPLGAAAGLDPAAQAMMFAQMPGLEALYRKLKPPQANVERIAPYAARIQAIIDAR